MYTVALDTCAVWSSTIRDLLLSFAVEGLYRPIISAVTLDELQDSEFEKLEPLLGADQAAARSVRLVAEIRAHFDDAIIDEIEQLEGAFGLPDPDDEHVVAAAVLGGAAAIVTENLKHFPANCMPGGIEVLLPSTFILLTAELDPSAAASALRSMAARTGRLGPKRSAAALLDGLCARPGLQELRAIIGRGV